MCSGQMGQLVPVTPCLTLTDRYLNTVVCFFLSPFCYLSYRQWVPDASCRHPLPRHHQSPRAVRSCWAPQSSLKVFLILSSCPAGLLSHHLNLLELERPPSSHPCCTERSCSGWCTSWVSSRALGGCGERGVGWSHAHRPPLTCVTCFTG